MNASKGYSFKELSSRSLSDFELDDEEEENKPKKNPFDFEDANVSVESTAFEFVSQSEVKEFLNTSRGITYNPDDTDGSLGEPWGGAQYSLSNEKSKSGENAKSARFRSESFNSTQSSSSSIQSQRQSTPSPKAIPSRTLAAQVNNKISSSVPSFASKPASSATHSSPSINAGSFASKPASSTTQSSSSINAGSFASKPASSTTHSSPSINASAIRDKTGNSSGHQPAASTKKSSLQSASISISEAVSSVPQISANEYYRLQKEVGQLRKDLQAAKQSRLKPLPVAESVKRIVHGQPYSLELHKSLQDKVDLLDCALKVHDGNAIIAVILFLKRTVKNGIFRKELCKRPKAVNHYCKFLQQHYDFNELAQLYRILGRYEDAAILKFKQAVKIKDPSIRLQTLQEVLRVDISTYPKISPECVSAVQDNIKLLEMQISLELSDSTAELERRNLVMNIHPRQASIPLLPVITTVFYCCMYHYTDPEGSSSSPLALRNTFKIAEKQYEWTAIAACAKVKRWKEIEELLKGKGWFGSSKLRSLIGFERVVMLVFQSKAPEEVLSKYLKLIDDINKRLSMAAKYKSHDVVIETLVAMKDRQKLVQYREHLPTHAPQHQTITNFLRNSQIKWKN